jgi:hypothetical protein
MGGVFLPSVRAPGRVASAVVLAVSTGTMAGAELQPQTVAAFDRYVRATESRMAGDSFLHIDSLPPDQGRTTLLALRRGELHIERMSSRESGTSIDVPDGMIHHWLGTVFVDGATLDQALALLQDYDRHSEIYRPAIAQSRTLARDGDVFRVQLRFSMKKVITVVVNSENEARFTRLGSDRAQSRIRSLRIAEVANPGTPLEHEYPVGRDGGYLWRLYTYWRFLERDGGTYVQCEAVSLTRSIPRLVSWLVGPFVTSIPRESLTFTLVTTRAALTRD